MRPKDISLTKAQIREFLNRLAGCEGCQYEGIAQRCGGPQFTYAKEILTLMGIDEAEQKEFLALCKEYGGYCDCEILMNVLRVINILQHLHILKIIC